MSATISNDAITTEQSRFSEFVLGTSIANQRLNDDPTTFHIVSGDAKTSTKIPVSDKNRKMAITNSVAIFMTIQPNPVAVDDDDDPDTPDVAPAPNDIDISSAFFLPPNDFVIFILPANHILSVSDTEIGSSSTRYVTIMEQGTLTE